MFRIILLRVVCTLALLMVALPGFSQSVSLSLKFFGLSIHPKGAVNAPLMPLKLDSGGVLVLNRGLTFNVEVFLWEDIVSVKFIQGLYSDCLARFAGFTHIGLRGRIFELGQHSLNGGIGPTLLYRRNWYEVQGYDDSFSFFRGSPQDYWQRRFIWYGGEFEYNYAIDEKRAISTSFVPGYPDLMNLSIGLRLSEIQEVR